MKQNHVFIVKKNSNKKNFEVPKNLIIFKHLFSRDNFSRISCITLPFNAVLKALK